jgi:uncharacterized protein (TIGR00251 family)
MLQSVDNGVVITVRVIPRAGKSAVAGTRGDALLVRLRSAPVEGAANEELIEVIAKQLGVAKRAVEIISGQRSREKRVQVSGVDVESASKMLGLS